MTMAGVCEPGDVLGLVDGDVVLVASDPVKVASDLVDRLLGGGGELVTMVHGAGPVGRCAAAVRDQLHATRPDVECLAYDAGAARDLLLLGVE
jgi:dihydroxyacetone kinase-like predicted kinase